MLGANAHGPSEKTNNQTKTNKKQNQLWCGARGGKRGRYPGKEMVKEGGAVLESYLFLRQVFALGAGQRRKDFEGHRALQLSL